MNQTIEFDKAELNINEGNSSRTGNKYKIITQMGWLHTEGDKYPVAVAYPIEQPEGNIEPKAYPVGNYQVDTNSLLTTGAFDALDIIRHPKLVPLKRS